MDDILQHLNRYINVFIQKIDAVFIQLQGSAVTTCYLPQKNKFKLFTHKHIHIVQQLKTIIKKIEVPLEQLETLDLFNEDCYKQLLILRIKLKEFLKNKDYLKSHQTHYYALCQLQQILIQKYTAFLQKNDTIITQYNEQKETTSFTYHRNLQQTHELQMLLKLSFFYYNHQFEGHHLKKRALAKSMPYLVTLDRKGNIITKPVIHTLSTDCCIAWINFIFKKAYQLSTPLDALLMQLIIYYNQYSELMIKRKKPYRILLQLDYRLDFFKKEQQFFSTARLLLEKIIAFKKELSPLEEEIKKTLTAITQTQAIHLESLLNGYETRIEKAENKIKEKQSLSSLQARTRALSLNPLSSNQIAIFDVLHAIVVNIPFWAKQTQGLLSNIYYKQKRYRIPQKVLMLYTLFQNYQKKIDCLFNEDEIEKQNQVVHLKIRYIQTIALMVEEKKFIKQQSLSFFYKNTRSKATSTFYALLNTLFSTDLKNEEYYQKITEAKETLHQFLLDINKENTSDYTAMPG